MVYVVEVKPGLFYAYRSVRLPGHKYPVKQYIGPASQAIIKAQRRKQAEAVKRNKRRCSPTPDKSSDASPISNQSSSNISEKLDYKKSV